MNNNKGFTKIELLVTGAIVGLLGIMAVVAVVTARARMRDAIRLSDIRQIQNGLEQYFIDTNSYPVVADTLALGLAHSSCLSNSGFGASCASADSVYLSVVPATPTPGLHKTVSCNDNDNVYCYSGNMDSYSIEFELEYANPLLQLQKGINCAMPSELKAGACAL